MKFEGLIFFIAGIILCVVGWVYSSGYLTIASFLGGLVLVIVSMTVMFPNNPTGVDI